MSEMQSKDRRIAVIGAGISGLTAAYILQRSASVTVYEAGDRLGGHAHTHHLDTPSGRKIAIDSGFIVFSHKSYPNLSRLFDELGVETKPARFSFAIRCDGCGLEYLVARDISGLFPHVKTADRTKYLALLAQIPIFNRAARQLARQGFDGVSPSLGEFLASGKFTKYFIQHYVVPLVSALWSCAPGLVPAYPARYVVRYLEHHGLLSTYKAHGWRTVRGGSYNYVDRISQTLTDVRPATPVEGVRRTSKNVEVLDSKGQVEKYDSVVMATHADESLHLLSDATEAEYRILGSFAYSRNTVTIHTDTSVLSRRPHARGTWNYRLGSCSQPRGAAQITYHMNKLHGFEASDEYLVTLNDTVSVNQSRIIAEVTYEHPIDSAASVAARSLLPTLTTMRTAYAGSYHGWSSHEDGCRSGVEAASSLGVRW
jgi:uncharacterized protein